MLITKKYAENLNLCTINLCHGQMLLDQNGLTANLVESWLVWPLANIDHRANCTIHLEFEKQFKILEQGKNFLNINNTYEQIANFSKIVETVQKIEEKNYLNTTTTKNLLSPLLRRKQKKSNEKAVHYRINGFLGLDNLSSFFF